MERRKGLDGQEFRRNSRGTIHDGIKANTVRRNSTADAGRKHSRTSVQIELTLSLSKITLTTTWTDTRQKALGRTHGGGLSDGHKAEGVGEEYQHFG